MNFAYREQPHWPPLSWVARMQASSSQLEVLHGPRVERCNHWFGEIVWDGDFPAADFDRTDIVAGSGARLRDGHVEFVSSGSTVDRLALLRESPDCCYISNSLPALLSLGSVSLEAHNPNYIPDILSIAKGLSKGVRQLQTTSTPVELIYYDNYRWDGRQGRRIEKPFPKRDFSCYESYVGFLKTCIQRLSDNLQHVQRKYPFQLVTTISSGYDSPTIAAIAREYGCHKALTFCQSRDGSDDSGSEVGNRLGLQTFSADSDAWKRLDPLEAVFYGAAGFMGEIVYRGHEEQLGGAVVLTGYHGDGVWGLRKKYESEDLVRGDCSGLALSEYRLWTGFVNCPVAFFGARQIVDIHRLAQQPEMEPWSLQGTDYNRPICRRIVEEAGVPRELFGVDKKAVGLPGFYLSKSSRRDYMKYLRQHQREWLSRGRMPPIRSKRVDDVIDHAQHRLYNLCLAAVHLKRRQAAGNMATNVTISPSSNTASGTQFIKRMQDTLFQPRNLHRYVVPWALEKCKQKYAPLG